ncbi:MAG TPA: diaminopimelate epimerase [Gaiellaceae bacterium]|nr:diaminopimelate epimerase [Gaiellaceae bacterium]
MRSSTWRALGNTYRVVDPEGAPLDASRARDLAAGTDGVVEVMSERGSTLEIAIWNPDGSLAELSGNGTRIAAAWLAERTGAREIEVVTAGRTVRARLLDDGHIEQDLGEVAVGHAETIDGVTFTSVSVGNPHAVVVGDPDDILRIGPLLETHTRFPDRTNVQVVRIDREGEVTARVWERGVGETLSSGTSAVAVAAATHASGPVLVHFPGGDLRVLLEGGRATLVGPVERLD